MANVKVLCLFLAGFLFPVYTFGQQSEIAGFYLEKMEDIRRWDSIMIKQLELPAYSHVSLLHLSVDSFEDIIINNQVQIVDVRTEEEYLEGHISGAILIDVKSDDFTENAGKFLNIYYPVAVYCKGGVRSRRASEKLLSLGFSVYNLSEGFEQWKKEVEQ